MRAAAAADRNKTNLSAESKQGPAGLKREYSRKIQLILGLRAGSE